MPSVGTLNLTVESNASAVSGSLGELAGALGRVKKAIPENGLGLSNIGTEINTFVTTITNIKSSSSAFKSIESLGNGLVGIAKFMKFSTDSVAQSTDKLGKSVSTIDMTPVTKAIGELKRSIKDGLHLGQAGTQLKNLRDAINGEWNVDNASTVGDALRAIGDGAKSIDTTHLGTVAQSVSSVAKALNEYAEATWEVKDAIGNGTQGKGAYDLDSAKEKIRDWREGGFKGKMPLDLQFFGRKGTKKSEGQLSMDLDGTAERLKEIVSQINITDAATRNVVQSVDETSKKIEEVISNEKLVSQYERMSGVMRELAMNTEAYGNAIDVTLPKIQAISSAEMIDAGNERFAAMSEMQQKLTLAKATGEINPGSIRETAASIDMVNTSVQSMRVELSEIGNTVTSVIIPAFNEMYQIWSQMSYEFDAFKMQGFRLTEGNNPLLLGNGTTPGQLLLGDGSEPQTFLSTWVAAGEQFKTDWVFFVSDAAEQWRAAWSPDWILGGWSVPVSMSTFHLGSGESPLLLGDGGVSPENALSTAVDYSEQWKQDWIIGEGTVSDVEEEVERVTEATNEAADAAEKYRERFEEILKEKKSENENAERIREGQLKQYYGDEKEILGLDKTNEMADNLTQLDLLQAQLREAEVSYNHFVNELGAGASKTIKQGLKVQELRDKIWEYKDALASAREEQEESSNSTISLASAFEATKKGIQKMFPTLSSLIKRFGNIAKYRMLRSVLRYITAGFSEGVKNVYQYSQTVGTALAPAMDSAASSLLKMKNSIGAAVAPVIQALVPVLQTVVNWIITAVNYLNQFLALLNGQTSWTQAVDTATQAYDNNANAANNAAKAAKDLLADWDELNIIQSQDTGGGGGHGGQTPTDFSSMFQEVNEFSQKVKDIIKFIEDHLGGLEGLLKKLGTLILGWKFSKAFSGFLGTLGKLVAGGALIAIGLDLSYGAGFEAGAKGYWDPEDILLGIVGGIASAIGGSIITNALGLGGALGFGIGLTLAAVVTLVGWLNGQKDLQDKNKWGNLSMTREQIEKFVKGQFTFDVESAITILDSVIQNEQIARENLNQKITDFKNSLDAATVQAGIDIDSSETGETVKTAYRAANDAIDAVENLMKTSNDGLTVLIKSFRLENAAGEDVTEDLMKDISIADTTLKDYFTGIGEQLAYWIGEGERNGYTADITQNALALMEREKKILEKAKEFEAELDFNTKLSASMDKIIDRDTALEQKQYQEELLTEYRNKSEQAWQEQYKTAIEMAGIAQGAADDALEQAKKAQEAGDIDSYNTYMKQYDDLLNSVDTYQKKATAALNAIEQIDDQLAATKENMAQQWAETLKAVYGVDYDTQVKNALNGGFYDVDALEAVLNPFGDSYSLNRENYLKHGIIDTANKLREKVYGWLLNPDSDYSGLNAYYLKDLGGNAFDLLTDEAKQNLIRQLYEITENELDVQEILHQAFGLSYDRIDPLLFDIPVKPNIEIVEPNNKTDETSWGIFDIFRFHPPEEDVQIPVTVEPVVEEDKLKELKKEIETAMSDGIMSTDEAFDLMIKYGFGEFDQALKELQYNLDEEGRNRGALNNQNPILQNAIASSGSQVEPLRFRQDETGTGPEAETVNYEQMEQSVKNGSTEANTGIINELGEIAQRLERILAKQWVVNINASPELGRTVGRAAEQYGRTTG